MELDQDAFSEVFMIPLSSAISSGLTWSNIARNRGYELRLTCEVVSTLRRPGFFSSSFLAETQEGHWRFCRGGLLGAGSITFTWYHILQAKERQAQRSWGDRCVASGGHIPVRILQPT
jgi:hypothetical protein